ncbi:MAG: ZIP family metal transporter, partial [Elusimicrobia bacterium]|nr:ZIP family metal transporter [Elusimicrobiota bacterium]
SVAFGDVLPEAWAASPRLAGSAAFSAFALCYAAEYLAIGDSCHEAVEDCRSHALGGAALAGVLVHSFVDGVNLAAARLAGINPLIAAGAAVIVCHFADGFTLTTLFSRSGFRREAVWGLLAAVGLSTAAGAAAASSSSAGLAPEPAALLLGFAGGCFVYVGAADIIPRLHRDHDPAALGYFAAGAAAMAGLHALLG